MTDIVAGVEVPDTQAVAEATRLARETTSPLIFHHSRRVFFFSSILARGRGLEPDPELLYLSAIFHDAGLLRPYGQTQQRFELDGADHALAFLQERAFPEDAAQVVWTAIALHTTPGIPMRLGPEVAATNLGVVADAVGIGLDEVHPDQVAEVVASEPREDFEDGFLQAFVEGLKDRPDTTYGTVNADVLERFVPDFRRTNMVDRILHSPWAK
ncbi:HD domain-containing protein [Nocardioides sp. LHG3406-4]|uniref:HD domain-containing protein n=1 Tax=Nocardioides sp. LHG3406-4 TaxID=2804575 RepID=UPI003CEAB67E